MPSPSGTGVRLPVALGTRALAVGGRPGYTYCVALKAGPGAVGNSEPPEHCGKAIPLWAARRAGHLPAGGAAAGALAAVGRVAGRRLPVTVGSRGLAQSEGGAQVAALRAAAAASRSRVRAQA